MAAAALSARDPRGAYFERLAATWDASQPPGRPARLRTLWMGLAPWWRGAQAVLDVGAGSGALLPLLHEALPGARLVAVDLAAAMLRCAQARGTGAAPVQADAHALPFPPACFDAVLCDSALPHLRDRPHALREMARLLRPGGALIVLHDAGREAIHHIHAHADRAIRHDMLPERDELARLLVDAGLTDVMVDDAADHCIACARAVADV